VILDNDRATTETGYLTDRLGDAACKFIEKNKDQPFYLFVSFTAPHGPLEPRKNSDDTARVSHIKEKNRQGYAGLVIAMDDNVGKILSALENNGLKDSTLVVFTNDNGGPQGTGTSNFPLKGHKGSLEEGGIRVPWAMSWPNMINPGSVINEPIIALDILPTVFDVAGEPVRVDWKLDGRSMLPLLKDPKAKVPQRTLYWRRKGVEGPIALREGDWKLLMRNSPQGKPELYNLDTDIGESRNVAAENPEIVARLTSKLSAWESELTTPLWGPGSLGFVERVKRVKK
jgi:arylsulfatase A-like enzyme